MTNFETERLKIRMFKMEDAKQVYHNWAKDESIAECSDFRNHNCLEETKTIIASIIRETKAGIPAWALVEKQTKKLVGFVRVMNTSQVNKRCNITFDLAYSSRGKRYIKEALEKIIPYLQKEGYQLIETELYDIDPELTIRKGKELERAKMKKEAVLKNRKINPKTGKPIDLIIYSIIKEEEKSINKIAI